MEQILFMAASLLEEKDIVEQLTEAIKEYELNPSTENFEKLTMPCILVTTRMRLNHTEGDGAEKFMNLCQEFDRFEKTSNLLDPNES